MNAPNRSKSFDTKVFLFVLSIALAVGGIGLGVALAGSTGFTAFRVFIIVLATLLGAIAFASIVASYYIPIRAASRIYRVFMRRLAKRAIRSSLSIWLTRIECLSIMYNDGTVALKVGIGSLQGVVLEDRLNVYDNGNEELWGRVIVIEVDEKYCLCEPYDRVNPDFWEHLETRMRIDTSPPAVYLVRQLPESLLEQVEDILDNWK